MKMKYQYFNHIHVPGDGDCFFNCISYALNSQMDNKACYYTSSILRDELSKSITYDKYTEIIQLYKIYYDNNEFFESWDPYTITYDDFLLIIKDNDIWGDYLLLNQFINTFQLNILILNVDTIDNQFYVYNTLHKYNTDNKTIILNYINEMHFTLVGYFDSKKMVSLFTHDILPEEISILFTPSNILNRSE